MSCGLGSEMLNHPDLIRDCVRSVRSNVPNLPVSVKIRICLPTHETINTIGQDTCQKKLYNGGDMGRTLSLVRVIEDAGAGLRVISVFLSEFLFSFFEFVLFTLLSDYITIHGRTCLNTSAGAPVSLEAIAMVKEAASIPVIGNGDIFSLAHAQTMIERTHVDGVMSARGLLQNPMLFTGADRVSVAVLKDMIDLATTYTLSYKLLHNHMMMMTFPLLGKSDRQTVTMCNSYSMLWDVCHRLFL